MLKQAIKASNTALGIYGNNFCALLILISIFKFHSLLKHFHYECVQNPGCSIIVVLLSSSLKQGYWSYGNTQVLV